MVVVQSRPDDISIRLQFHDECVALALAADKSGSKKITEIGTVAAILIAADKIAAIGSLENSIAIRISIEINFFLKYVLCPYGADAYGYREKDDEEDDDSFAQLRYPGCRLK